MKLERYKDKKETRRKVMLISLTVITLVSVTMMLYKTFANFRTTTSFPIMSGKVIYKKKGLELGKDIQPSEDAEGGLYVVVPTLDGWTKTEYRYGGKNPNNYVNFNCDDNGSNCELWRIIGLVNVKANNGTIEQRLKIIRNESIGDYSWDKYLSASTGDWTQTYLKDTLNNTYYNSLSGLCYDGGNSWDDKSQVECDFTIIGLKKDARQMIDDEVIWNIGGWNNVKILTNVMYEKERGTNTMSDYPYEWSIETDKNNNHKGVGLMYASDYGYAVGGSVRNTCLNSTNLSEYNKNDCYTNDWLYISGADQWALSPNTNYEPANFITSRGYLLEYSGMKLNGLKVRPTVYLKSNVKIGEGLGTSSIPYHLVIS